MIPFLSQMEPQAPLKLSLVLFNAHQALLTTTISVLEGVIPGNYELLLISPLTLDLLKDYPQLRYLEFKPGEHKVNQIINAWESARGEILGLMEENTPPEILLQLLVEIEKGADLAFANSDPPLLSNWGRIVSYMILPEVINRLRDPFSNCFLVHRRAIAGRYLTHLGSQLILDVIARGKLKSLAPINYPRKPRLTLEQYLDYFQHLIKLRLALSARFVRFCVVGIGGVFLDMSALYLLSDPNWFNLPLEISKLIAAELAVINNFLWNDFWTFRDLASQQPGILNKFKRLLKFNFVCLTGLIISVVLLDIFYKYLGFATFAGGKYVANLLAIALVTFWNFWLHSRLSWRPKRIKN